VATGFLVDKFGKYKPVVILTLLLNALFHHALFIIPQQEIPGQIPSAFIMRHPTSGNVEVFYKYYCTIVLFRHCCFFEQVWWSPCPSRECPEEEEINIVVDSCVDYCLLLEPNPKIEIIPQSPTKSPIIRNDDLDDLNFKVSKKKPTNQTKDKITEVGTEMPTRMSSEPTFKLSIGNKTIEIDEEGSQEESWVADRFAEISNNFYYVLICLFYLYRTFFVQWRGGIFSYRYAS
jgi:hypothetical protein